MGSSSPMRRVLLRGICSVRVSALHQSRATDKTAMRPLAFFPACLSTNLQKLPIISLIHTHLHSTLTVNYPIFLRLGDTPVVSGMKHLTTNSRDGQITNQITFPYHRTFDKMI